MTHSITGLENCEVLLVGGQTGYGGNLSEKDTESEIARIDHEPDEFLKWKIFLLSTAGRAQSGHGLRAEFLHDVCQSLGHARPKGWANE